jgi:hypothetical protein
VLIIVVERKETEMFEYKTLIITKRGNKQTGENFSVHKFHITSEEQANAIINHPAFAGWHNGISIGYSKEIM